MVLILVNFLITKDREFSYATRGSSENYGA